MRKIGLIALALIITLGLVGTAFADIQLSGHVVTTWSDAQHDDNINSTNNGNTAGVDNSASLYLGSSPITAIGATRDPLSVAGGIGGNAGRAAARFAVAEIELDIDADITDNITTRIDLESDGAGNYDVEAAYIKLVQPFDVPFDVIVGKFVAPIGVEPQEQIDRKLITASLVDNALPLTTTGIAISGTISAVDYVLYYVEDMAAGDNDSDSSTQNSKAMGARLATSPLEGLDIGISYFYDSLGTEDAIFTNTDRDYTAWDFDAVYANGPFEFRGEYLKASETDTDSIGGDFDLAAYSMQLSYDVDEQIRLVGRYARTNPQAELSRAAGNLTRLNGAGNSNSTEITVTTLGASYSFSENAIFKLEYDIVQTDNVTNTPVYDPNDNLIACELTVAF